jgi:hypothetical protein
MTMSLGEKAVLHISSDYGYGSEVSRVTFYTKPHRFVFVLSSRFRCFLNGCWPDGILFVLCMFRVPETSFLPMPI